MPAGGSFEGQHQACFRNRYWGDLVVCGLVELEAKREQQDALDGPDAERGGPAGWSGLELDVGRRNL